MCGPMARRWVRGILVVVFALLAASCQHNPIPNLLVTKGQKEREIAALRADFDQKLAANRAEIDASTAKVREGMQAQMRGAAGAFYGQDFVYRTLQSPTRTDLVWHNLTLEGWSALGNLQPTFEQMQAMNERLTAELDETRTSLADLQRNHQQALEQNRALADATKRFESELAAAEARRIALEADFKSRLDKAQLDLIDTQSRLIAAEKARSDDAKARQAQLARLSWGAGILAALCLAGAIWSPIAKRQLIIGAVVLGGAAVAIPFVEGWHILVGVGVAAVGLIAWTLYGHRKDERVADALVLAAQDVKEKSREVWEQHLKPAVADRLARYTTGPDGKLVTERDPTLEAHIDAKLAEYDALPGKTALITEATNVGAKTEKFQ